MNDAYETKGRFSLFQPCGDLASMVKSVQVTKYITFKMNVINTVNVYARTYPHAHAHAHTHTHARIQHTDTHTFKRQYNLS